MNTDATTKLTHQRLSILERAQRLNNVSEACRQRGISRTTYYEYKRRFEEQGLEGLKDVPPVPKSHPFTTAPDVVERITEPSLLHPARGQLNQRPVAPGRYRGQLPNGAEHPQQARLTHPL